MEASFRGHFDYVWSSEVLLKYFDFFPRIRESVEYLQHLRFVEVYLKISTIISSRHKHVHLGSSNLPFFLQIENQGGINDFFWTQSGKILL